MSEVKEHSIRISKKFDKPCYSAEVKLRDICNQLTMLLYNKSLTTGVNGCIGEPSQILTKHHALKDKVIRVYVDKIVWDDSNKIQGTIPQGMHRQVNGSWLRLVKTDGVLNRYLNNVIRHGKKHGLDIELMIVE